MFRPCPVSPCRKGVRDEDGEGRQDGIGLGTGEQVMDDGRKSCEKAQGDKKNGWWDPPSVDEEEGCQDGYSNSDDGHGYPP